MRPPRGRSGYTNPRAAQAVRGSRYGGISVDGVVLLEEDHKTVEKPFKQFEKVGDDAHAERAPGDPLAVPGADQ